MIIDFRADPRHAERFDILCARTGENLNHWNIVYADDDAGFVRFLVTDEAGDWVFDEVGMDVVEGQRHRAIKIVGKSTADLAAIDADARRDERMMERRAVERN